MFETNRYLGNQRIHHHRAFSFPSCHACLIPSNFSHEASSSKKRAEIFLLRGRKKWKNFSTTLENGSRSVSLLSTTFPPSLLLLAPDSTWGWGIGKIKMAQIFFRFVQRKISLIVIFTKKTNCFSTLPTLESLQWHNIGREGMKLQVMRYRKKIRFLFILVSPVFIASSGDKHYSGKCN